MYGRTLWLPLLVPLLLLMLLLACSSGGGVGVQDADAEATTPATPDVGIAAPEVTDTGIPDADLVCTPTCAERECGPDGCGGSCGGCASGRMCSADYLCVPDPGACDHTCASLGLVCGEHCGEDCGACAGPQEVCEQGACVCAPDCPVEACEADDGCGGICPACPSDVSCEGCPLVLSVFERVYDGAQLRGVILALDYAPEADAVRPGVADLRLRVDGPARLDGVALGAAVLDADKGLHTYGMTGKPYRRTPDGALQFLLLSTQSARRVEAGRWLFFRFVFPPGDGGPVSFRLVKRAETLAPSSADQALWGSALDAPVVVWPEVAP